jgi:hypothetical protein
MPAARGCKHGVFFAFLVPISPRVFARFSAEVIWDNARQLAAADVMLAAAEEQQGLVVVCSSHRRRLLGFARAVAETRPVFAGRTVVVHGRMDGTLKWFLIRGGLDAHLNNMQALLLGFTSTVESGYNLPRAHVGVIVLANVRFTQPPWGLFQMLGRARPGYSVSREILFLPGSDCVDFNDPANPRTRRLPDGTRQISLRTARCILRNPACASHYNAGLPPGVDLNFGLLRLSASAGYRVVSHADLIPALAHAVKAAANQQLEYFDWLRLWLEVAGSFVSVRPVQFPLCFWFVFVCLFRLAIRGLRLPVDRSARRRRDGHGALSGTRAAGGARLYEGGVRGSCQRGGLGHAGGCGVP